MQKDVHLFLENIKSDSSDKQRMKIKDGYKHQWRTLFDWSIKRLWAIFISSKSLAFVSIINDSTDLTHNLLQK